MLKLLFYIFFSGLSSLNQIFLPRFSGKNLQNFNAFQIGILGYKYWVTKNYLKYRK
tara:strand:+ start:18506 stop:18673 length:168 start_codon:yes stop_codon:yes gene_type:complete